MAAISFMNTKLANPPTHLHLTMREHMGLTDYRCKPLEGELSQSNIFDCSRVQANLRGEYVIDEKVVLAVEKNLQLNILQISNLHDQRLESSHKAAWLGVGTMLMAGAFVCLAILLPELALPLYILAGVAELVSLKSFAEAYFDRNEADRLEQLLNTPVSINEQWIARALRDVLELRDVGFREGFEFALRNIPKEVFSREERRELYEAYLDASLNLNPPCIPIADKLAYLS